MRYTLRNVPAQPDEALGKRAQAERKSPDDVAIEPPAEAVGLSGAFLRHRDVSDVRGTWVEDADVESALVDQRRIDPDLWRGRSELAISASGQTAPQLNPDHDVVYPVEPPRGDSQ